MLKNELAGNIQVALKSFNLNGIFKAIPLIDIWLIREIMPPILFGISAFTVLSLSIGVILDLIRKIISHNLPIFSAFEVLFFRLPSYLVLAFPMATLLGCLIAFSKLSTNSEIKALLSLGYSRRRIISSAIFIGICMSILTFIFNNSVVPYSNMKADLALRKGLGQTIDISYKTDVQYSKFNSDNNLEILFYAREYKDKAMNDITIVDYSKLNQKTMIVAEKGIWNKSEKEWILFNGKLLSLNDNKLSTLNDFSQFKYNLGYGPFKIATIPVSSNNMTLRQAYSAIDLYNSSGNIKEKRRLKVRIQEKYSMPFSCLIFSIIGSSLAIKKTKTKGGGQSLAFGISIILIMLYYTVTFLFSSLGISGVINPIMAAWTPIIIFLFGTEYITREVSLLKLLIPKDQPNINSSF